MSELYTNITIIPFSLVENFASTASYNNVNFQQIMIMMEWRDKY